MRRLLRAFRGKYSTAPGHPGGAGCLRGAGRLRAGEEVRAALSRAPEGLLAAPAGDLGVVPGEEHVRDAPAPELGRAGVLGVLQQSGAVRFVHRGEGGAQGAGEQTHDGVHQHHRRQLAPAEDVVSDGDLLVDGVLPDALVDALVVATDEDQVPSPREGGGGLLAEDLSLGGEQDDVPPSLRYCPAQALDGGDHRLRLEHHPRPAPVGVVVYGAVAVGRPVAQVMDAQVEEPGGAGAGDDALVEGPAEHGGEEGQDVDPHQGLLSGGSAGGGSAGGRLGGHSQPVDQSGEGLHAQRPPFQVDLLDHLSGGREEHFAVRARGRRRRRCSPSAAPPPPCPAPPRRRCARRGRRSGARSTPPGGRGTASLSGT